MDELVDILDSQGNLTGKTALKSEAHKNGWPHPTVHVWFFTSDGKVLLQQRAKNKSTFPLLWDVSVAGHVNAGEPIKEAAIREVREEIGLDILKDDLQKIAVFRATHKHPEDIIDREFHHVFLSGLKVGLQTLTKQESEVNALTLMPLLRFAEETWGLANPGKYVPHGAEYYQSVVKAIKGRIEGSTEAHDA
ncbi:NUDIX domain-containing protein [Pricia sp. S334]|uniref:NUDIX domain-containing protein n=1 Tax=Pricia mediterranea TaxID=3076079 RepID=A0ABU3L9B4_9FLAO|nr:NUDIX domain-containing protein [Pricia sp. S334]MDT7830314.1 NUDIX domain-containing protein [Pricia sp. S334]